MRKVLLNVGLLCLTMSAGCVAAYNQNEQALRQDFDNCSVYGTEANSPAHARCMALQRQRRELAIEQQNAVTERNNDYIASRRY